MNDNEDKYLETLFRESEQVLDGEAFTAKVISKSRFHRYQKPVILFTIASVIFIFSLMFIPVFQEITMVVHLMLTKSLFNLGSGVVAWLLAPINNIAGLLIFVGKSIYTFKKKVMKIGVVY
jgi:hypothetical protein